MGLTVLSVIASTSPFIGLFGTVVSILQTFATMGSAGQASMSVLAPQISEALIATAAGILVAIFAYAFFALLKRKAHEVVGYLTMHKDLLLSEPS
jgi:biopolymer transport protein ExbB/TolQ